MDTLMLNIGLLASPRFLRTLQVQAIRADASTLVIHQLAPRVVSDMVASLEFYGFTVLRKEVLFDGAEPTLVVQVRPQEHTLVHTSLLKFSRAYAQDCIAVQFLDGAGELVGDHTNYWACYQPEKFRGFSTVELNTKALKSMCWLARYSVVNNIYSDKG